MRSKEMQAIYDAYKESNKDPDALHKEPAILEWKYWRLVNNRFPYTKVATAHAMVVLKRNCSISEVSANELAELWLTILPWADKVYDTSIINMAAMRSIASTPHIHLITYLPEYK